MADASLSFNILTKYDASGTRRAERDMSQLDGTTKRTTGTFKRFATVGAAAIATGLGVATVASVRFGVSAVNSASNLNETLNKSNTIFGKNAAEIRKWSRSSAKSFGLSRAEALDSAASFGDMFKQIGFTGDQATRMSKKVVQMSADFGSFNNLPTAEVSDMISAAFRGEYDSLQRVIPNINAARVQKEALARTGKEVATQLTAEEKAAATLAIINRDGARAQGDFARTSGGLANQQKILSARFENVKTKIGTALLPVALRLVTLLNDKGIPAFRDIADAVMKADWKGVSTDLKTAAPTVEQLADGLNKASAEMPAFSSVAGVAGGLLKKLADNSGLLAKAIPYVVAGFIAFKAAQAAANTAALISVPVRIAEVFAIRAQTAAMKQLVVAQGVSTVATAVGTGVVTKATIATKLATAGQWLLNAALTANPIGLVVVAIGLLVGALAIAWAKSDKFKAIVTGAFRGVQRAASAAFGWVKANWPLILAVLAGPIGLAVLAINKHWDTIRSGIARVAGWFKALPGRIVGALSGIAATVKSIGHNIIAGMIAGVREKVSSLVQAARDAVSSAINAAKDKLGISSPSKVFRTIGNQTADGYIKGLEEKRTKIKDKVASLVQASRDAASSFRGSFSQSLFSADFGGPEGTGTPSVSGILDFQRQQAAKASALKSNVKSLLAKGLSKDLIGQLLQAGSSGEAQIAALAGGSMSQIAELNSLNKATNSSLSSAGASVGSALYGDQIRAARKDLQQVNITINVSGAIDKKGTAKQIRDMLLELKRKDRIDLGLA